MHRKMTRFLERFAALAREFPAVALIVLTVTNYHVIVVVRLCFVAFIAVGAAEAYVDRDVLFVVFEQRLRGTDEAPAFAENTRHAIVSGLGVRREKIHFFKLFVANVTSKSETAKKLKTSEGKLQTILTQNASTCHLLHFFCQ